MRAPIDPRPHAEIKPKMYIDPKPQRQEKPHVEVKLQKKALDDMVPPTKNVSRSEEKKV